MLETCLRSYYSQVDADDVKKHAVIKIDRWKSSGFLGVSSRLPLLCRHDHPRRDRHQRAPGLLRLLAGDRRPDAGVAAVPPRPARLHLQEQLEDYVTHDDDAGKAGHETLEFAHLDCPLEDDAGVFVIGKQQTVYGGNELQLTAFKVSTPPTIYIAPSVIHINDYLKGTWRTMLSD